MINENHFHNYNSSSSLYSFILSFISLVSEPIIAKNVESPMATLPSVVDDGQTSVEFAGSQSILSSFGTPSVNLTFSVRLDHMNYLV